MTEFNYECSLRRFNRRVSKYLSRTFGEPKVNHEKESMVFQSLSYISMKEDAKVEVNVHSDWDVKKTPIYNPIYILESKVQIRLDAGVDSPIRKKLERILKEL